ncbi:BglG family transcription antiterminator [Bacillus horti]|nr:BglG family transcription antiterminator [Bacillus horti]
MNIYISARERKILDYLLDKPDEVTVKDLADQIDVSVRTIHRDLKGVEDIVNEYDLRLIKKSGVGIKVEGKAEHIRNLKMFLFNASHNEYTPEERQTVILCALLETNEREPVKLVALAHELNVTIATISNDLSKLQEKLNGFGLILIRRRGYGVGISGSESSKRRAMSSLISKNIDEFEFLSFVRAAIQKKGTTYTNSISERLLGFVEKEKLLEVEKVLEEMNRELPYTIADSAYIGLVIHLALAIERILQGENIQIDQEYLISLQGTMEYSLAQKVIEKLEKVFDIQIPPAEIGYITMHLRGAKLRYDKKFLIEDASFNLAVKAKALIDYVGKQVQTDLTSHTSLLQGLVAHLRPAIFRIKQNMGIHNPLLPQIKADYAVLFSIIRDGVGQHFPDLDVPDEEIGYLVLHFGSALMGNREKEPVHALIICSSGIGTSKMLATRLQQEIPEIENPRNVSLFEASRLDLDEYDLIISTVHSPELPEHYILVNPILTKEEIAHIKDKIRVQERKGILGLKSSERFRGGQGKEQFLSSLEEMHGYTQAILTLLKHLLVHEIRSVQSSTDVISAAVDHLIQQGIVPIANGDAVKEAILEREKLGGLGIPDTHLALFHARHESIPTPSFSIYSLHEPLLALGMDQEEMEIKQVILLLAPLNASDQEMELLSYISTLIIEDEKSLELFHSTDFEAISSYVTNKFEQFYLTQFTNTIDKRRD